MPFYDEFDLSTVDVLLISQYVLGSFSFSILHCGGRDKAHHLQSDVLDDHGMRSSALYFCIRETMEYLLHHPVRLQ